MVCVTERQTLSQSAFFGCGDPVLLVLKCLYNLPLRQSLGEGEWKRKKHGVGYQHQWRKVHMGIDAQTMEILAIEVTDNTIGDAPMLPELLA
jgi:hypothetical protein